MLQRYKNHELLVIYSYGHCGNNVEITATDSVEQKKIVNAVAEGCNDGNQVRISSSTVNSCKDGPSLFHTVLLLQA